MATPLKCNVLQSSVVSSLFSTASLSAFSAFDSICSTHLVTLVFIFDKVKISCRGTVDHKACCRSFVVPVGVRSHLGLLHSWVTQKVLLCRR